MYKDIDEQLIYKDICPYWKTHRK